IEYELAHKMNDLYDLKKLICTFKGLEHRIMYGKYVEGKRLDEIAEELNYSAQYIYNKHAEIKGKLEYSDALKI
ncbi:phage protein, partial [Bacillus thuringiensis]|nr:phage protein [Bacillus thuringiensis]